VIREATKDEAEVACGNLAFENACHIDEVLPMLTDAAIVEGYISDSPGFTGDVMFLLFSGGPECNVVMARCHRSGGWYTVERDGEESL